jgi:hypothetical protein
MTVQTPPEQRRTLAVAKRSDNESDVPPTRPVVGSSCQGASSLEALDSFTNE